MVFTLFGKAIVAWPLCRQGAVEIHPSALVGQCLVTETPRKRHEMSQCVTMVPIWECVHKEL